MQATIVEAGIDYLSLHTNDWDNNTRITISEVIDAYKAFIGDEISLKVKSLLGYDGIGDDYFFVGQREDGYIRRIASSAADALYPQIFYSGDKPSRLDVQVTVRLDEDINTVIQTHKAEATASNLMLSKARQRSIEERNDNKGGMTIYIGSRHSEQFGRIYNKHAQKPEEHYANTIRYEVELHGDNAAVWAESLLLSAGRRHRNCVSYVKEWFEARGVATLIAQPTNRQIPPPIHRPPPTTLRTLQWLTKQVRPAVQRLLMEVDRALVLEALGVLEPDDSETRYTIAREG